MGARALDRILHAFLPGHGVGLCSSLGIRRPEALAAHPLHGRALVRRVGAESATFSSPFATDSKRSALGPRPPGRTTSVWRICMFRSIRNAALMGMLLGVCAQAGVVTAHGALKVQGNHIVDAHDNPIQLAGMSLYWSTFGGSTANWGANQFFNASVVSTMANDWKASLIRAPAGVISGSGQDVYNYPATMNLVKTVVDAAVANDIYVIVDWHLENSTPDLSDATQFFTEMSHTYKNTPNVIWEIWNEPKNVAWADIKSYANTMIPIIRDSSSNLIVVGTPNWSHNPDLASADPITTDGNVAYTLHFYADQNDPTGNVDADNNTAMAAANTAIQKVPLFITEWGTVNNSGSGNVNTSWSDKWLALAQSNGVSWANWSLCNVNEAASALIPSAGSNGGWSAGQLSASGTYVKAKIQAVGAAISTTGIEKIPSPAGFSARATGQGLSLELPAGVRELHVTDLQGRTLLRRAVSGQSRMQVALSGQGMVLVRLTTGSGEAVLPVLLSH